MKGNTSNLYKSREKTLKYRYKGVKILGLHRQIKLYYLLKKIEARIKET